MIYATDVYMNANKYRMILHLTKNKKKTLLYYIILITLILKFKAC